MSRGLDTDKSIYFYEQEFYALSNFSAFTLMWRGYRLDTSEAAYHWEKFPPDALHRMTGRESPRQEAIRLAPSAHLAFKLGQTMDGRREDWDDVKVDVMRRILRAKVDQHAYVRHKLLETGDRQLIENSWRDDFWGWGSNRDGQNVLGKLWMEIRESLVANAKEALHPSLLPAADTREALHPLLLPAADTRATLHPSPARSNAQYPLAGGTVRPVAPPAELTATRDPKRVPARLAILDPAETTTRQGVRNLGGNSRPRRDCPRSSTGRHHAGTLVVVGQTWAFDPLIGDYRTDDLGHRCVWCGKVLL